MTKIFRLVTLALALITTLVMAAPAGEGPVVVIHMDDTVQAVSAEYVTQGIAYAAQHQAQAVVLELDTPGGTDTAMRAIIQKIFASPVPVIGYVAPSGSRSASAGFYILLSCDVAAMAPGTNTGAAHPVVLGGAQPDKIEAAKIQSDAAAFMRSIASRRHRNVALAENGVIHSQSFTAAEALSDHLIDLTAPNLNQLLQQLDGKPVVRFNGATQTFGDLSQAPRIAFAMSLRERLLDMNSTLAFILLVVGAMLLYVEFTHPGMFVPGVIGGVLVLLALFTFSILPISWAGAGLFIAALVLFALELKFPTHGVLALGGIVCMALGGILLVDSPVPQLRVAWGAAIGVALGFGVVSLFLVQLVVRARRRRVTTGEQALIGEYGYALTELAPEGVIRIHGERWQAVAEQEVAAGSRIRVVRVEGMRLHVRPDQASTESGSGGSEATAGRC